MSLIKLPYLGSDSYAEQSKSPKGYTEVSNLHEYVGIRTRNVRIVRIDLILYLETFFTTATLLKYRDVIYYILAGYGSDNNYNNVLGAIKQLYKEDITFKLKLGELYYFRDDNLEKLSMLEALLFEAATNISSIYNKLMQSVPYAKVVCISKMYLYLSVNYDISVNELLLINGLEVISK